MASNMVRLLGNNSVEFQRFLDEQTPERVKEIMTAERVYTRDCQHSSLERDYDESFSGYSEGTAGITQAGVDAH